MKAGHLKFFEDKEKRKTLSVLPDKAAKSVEGSSFRVCRCNNPEDSRVIQGSLKSCQNRDLLSQEIAKLKKSNCVPFQSIPC